MEPAITVSEEQIERLIKTLERIAYALELANLPNAYTHTIPTGYQCQKCWQWVPVGMNHSCGFSSGSGSTAASYQCCNEYGPNGGRCYLAKDHSSDHAFAVVTNDG